MWSVEDLQNIECRIWSVENLQNINTASVQPQCPGNTGCMCSTPFFPGLENISSDCMKYSSTDDVISDDVTCDDVTCDVLRLHREVVDLYGRVGSGSRKANHVIFVVVYFFEYVTDHVLGQSHVVGDKDVSIHLRTTKQMAARSILVLIRRRSIP